MLPAFSHNEPYPFPPSHKRGLRTARTLAHEISKDDSFNELYDGILEGIMEFTDTCLKEDADDDTFDQDDFLNLLSSLLERKVAQRLRAR